MAATNTSLVISFNLCIGNNCKSFDIVDTTGIFNSLNNPGGWGGSPTNPVPADVEVCTLLLEFIDGTTVTLDLLALSYGGFPNSSELAFNITNVMSGFASGYSFLDGLVIATLTYSGTEINGDSVIWSSSTTINFFFTCQAECCLNKLLTQIDPSECINCKNDILDRVMKGFVYLDAAQASACCLMLSRATKLLQNAQFICNQISCRTC